MESNSGKTPPKAPTQPNKNASSDESPVQRALRKAQQTPLNTMDAPRRPAAASPTTSQPVMERPIRDAEEPVEEGSGTPWKKIGVFGFLGLVGVKVATKMFAGLLFTSGSVEASKYEKWTPEVKTEFIRGCHEEASKQIRLSTASNPPTDEQVNTVASTYCTCITDKVEGAHVVQTRYNALVESESTAAEKIGKQVTTYLETADGKVAVNSCFQLATGVDPTAAN